MFVMMCVLAGCDYLKSFKGIGIKTAYKIISKTTDLNKIIYKLKNEVQEINENYSQEFLKAIYSFRYHRVYCPVKRKMTFVNNLDESLQQNIGSLDFLGEELADNIVQDIADAKIHPLTKDPFKAQESLKLKRKMDDIFSKTDTLRSEVKRTKLTQNSNGIMQFVSVTTVKKEVRSKFFNFDSNKENNKTETRVNLSQILDDKKEFIKDDDKSQSEILDTFKIPKYLVLDQTKPLTPKNVHKTKTKSSLIQKTFKSIALPNSLNNIPDFLSLESLAYKCNFPN